MKYFILILCAVCGISGLQAQDQPPKPAKAVDTLRLPTQVVDRPLQVRLPDNARLAFGIEQNERAVSQIEARGQVTSVKGNIVEMSVANRQSVRLHYRLPANMRLTLSQGQRVSLQQRTNVRESSELYSIQMTGEQEMPLLSSARDMGEKPIRIEIAKGLLIRQIDRAPNTEKPKRVNVQLVPEDGDPRDVPLREAFPFEYRGRKYTLWVELSSWQSGDQGMIDVAGGYLLEFVVTAN